MPKGFAQMRGRLATVASELSAATAAALYQEAQEIIAEAQETLVPVRNHEGGTLRASGFVRPPEKTARGWRVVLGFGGGAVKYAAAVHENPRSGKTGGVSPRGQKYKAWAEVGEWKYLERPFLAAARELSGRVGRRVWAVLASRG